MAPEAPEAPAAPGSWFPEERAEPRRSGLWFGRSGGGLRSAPDTRQAPWAANCAVDEADPGDDQRGADDEAGVDDLAEDDGAQDDPDDRQLIGDERRSRGAPPVEEPEEQQVGDAGAQHAQPHDREDRVGPERRGQ